MIKNSALYRMNMLAVSAGDASAITKEALNKTFSHRASLFGIL